MRCRSCGAKIGWREDVCPVCRMLVTHDGIRRRLALALLAATFLAAILALIICLFW